MSRRDTNIQFFWLKTNLCNLLWKQYQNAETNFMCPNNRLHPNHKQTQYWLFIFNTPSVVSAFQTLQTSDLCQMCWLSFFFFAVNDTNSFYILLQILVAAVSGHVCVCGVCVCVCVHVYVVYEDTNVYNDMVWQVLQGEGDLWGNVQCPHNSKCL